MFLASTVGIAFFLACSLASMAMLNYLDTGDFLERLPDRPYRFWLATTLPAFFGGLMFFTLFLLG